MSSTTATHAATEGPEHKPKPVLKKGTEEDHDSKVTKSDSHDSNKDHHLKWDQQTVKDEPHECEPEFIEHRKQHYNEMEAVRKFRQEHPGDVLEETTEA
ncbi:hypothetical protein ACA910_013532 [Epithemia clementina (nom. ined.)]